MAGQDSHDNVKEKVQAVREVVPGKSNNEIVLVLQYYDYNVEKAIQAYFEDGAKEALGEWHVPTAKPNKKKKNKKKPSSPGEADMGATTPVGGAAASATGSAASTSSQSSVVKTPASSNGVSAISSSSDSKPSLPNGDLHYDAESRLDALDSSLLGAAAPGAALLPTPTAGQISGRADNGLSVNGSSPPVPSKAQNHPRTHSGSHGHGHGHHNHGRTRTTSERSTSSNVGAGGDNHSKRPFQGLEKSIKDLQRQTTSLERLRLVLEHETDRSYKSIKSVFEEMRTHLNVREKQLIAEMDVVKQQAYEVFKMRQEKAALLKVQIERAEKLSESELIELRADVKQFVADRKVDEELGKTIRFHYDSDHLKEELLTFGQVLPVKCAYSARRPSVSSVASSGVGTDDIPIPSPLSSSQPAPIQDGYQMTTDEMAELQTRLKNSLKIQGFSKGSPRPFSSSGATNSAAAQDDDRRPKNARRRNRNRERPEERRNDDTTTTANTANPAAPSSVSATDTRPSSHQPSRPQGDLHNDPLPQRNQPHSPSSRGEGGGSRGRGGRRGSGSGSVSGYRGQGQSRGSPRRPYSGGGGRGSGEPDRRQGGGRPVLVNGSAN